jgi:hypothetical protein
VDLLLVAHLAVTWMLVGLIWTIQILTYPQFRRVSEDDFIRYHFAHCWRLGLLLAPLLAIEGLSAAALWYAGHRESAFLASLVLMPVIWISTAVIQAPMHTRLMSGSDAELLRRLTLTNWVRTSAWTARGLLIASMLAR